MSETIQQPARALSEQLRHEIDRLDAVVLLYPTNQKEFEQKIMGFHTLEESLKKIIPQLNRSELEFLLRAVCSKLYLALRERQLPLEVVSTVSSFFGHIMYEIGKRQGYLDLEELERGSKTDASVQQQTSEAVQHTIGTFGMDI